MLRCSSSDRTTPPDDAVNHAIAGCRIGHALTRTELSFSANGTDPTEIELRHFTITMSVLTKLHFALDDIKISSSDTTSKILLVIIELKLGKINHRGPNNCNS